MGIPGHILTSTTATVIAFGLTRSISISLGVAIGSLLLDLDHILDYFFIDAQRSLSPVRFLTYYSTCSPRRRLLLLHSYEVLLILLAAAFLTGNRVVGGFAVGAFIHLAADFLPVSNLSLWSRIKLYSLGYRWRHGFDSSQLYRFE